MRIFDFAIIGSGPGGTAAASCFQDQENVLWIEEGSAKLNATKFSFGEIAEDYRNGGQSLIYSKPLVSVGLARVQGGGLSINSGLLQRPEKETFLTWPISTTPDWQWNALQSDFETVESYFKTTQSDTYENQISKIILKASKNLNWKFKPVLCVNRTQRNDFQSSVRNKLSMNGCHLLENTRLEKLERKGGLWHLKCLRQGDKLEFISKQVILSCGVLETPSLLFRSSLLGNRILPFKYHPTVKIIAEYDHEFNFETPEFSNIQIKEFAPSISIGSSVTSRTLIWTELVKHGYFKSQLLRNYNKQLLFYCSTSKCPPSYLVNFANSKGPSCFSFHNQIGLDMKEAIKKLVQFIFATGAVKAYLGGHEINSASEKNIENILSKVNPSVTAIHLFSSLPMGTAPNSLVDTQGAIAKTESLYCVDASIIPSSPAVNPQELVMAMANRITRKLLN